MEFSRFEQDYQNFYAPAFKLVIAGQNVADLGMEIVSVNVENTLDAADQASFTISNAFDVVAKEIRWYDREIMVGQRMEVDTGYADNLQKIFIGVITSMKINFPSGGMPQLDVTAFDLSHPMAKDKVLKTWTDQKDSDIATALANKHSLMPEVETTQPEIPRIKQDNESDFEFLKKRAQHNQFEFFVSLSKLHFRLPAYGEAAVVALEWGKSLLSFSPEIDIADQVQEVEARSWDSKQKREIIGRARAGDEEGREQGGRRSGGQLVQGASGETVVERVRRPVFSQQEADNLARSILTRIAEGLVKGSGECLGLPELRAGKNIELAGLGAQFSRSYYMEKTTHSISSSGYRTTFNVKEPTT